MAGLLLLRTIMMAMNTMLLPSSQHALHDDVTPLRRIAASLQDFFLPAAAILCAFMIVALIGIPIGHGFLWLFKSGRRARWRLRRRRLRRVSSM